MNITVNEDKIRAELECPARIHYSDPMKLRPAEVKVLCRWLAGLNAREIAAELGGSWQYINNMLSGMRVKLGVSGQVQLAYLAYDRGYVVIEECE